MEVQLWWADLRDWRPRSFIDHLDTVESGRMNGYQQDADRERFAVGAVLLRLAAAEAMGKRSERIIVDRTCAYCRRAHGRPSIVGAEIGVSVSHSADIVVVATTESNSVGIDVERIDDAIDVDAVAAAVLGGDESCVNLAEFLTYWCRKEAVVKATGDGLGVPLSAVRLSGPHEPPALRSYPGGTPLMALVDLEPPWGYHGALALVGAESVQVRHHGAAELLDTIGSRRV